MTKRYFVYERLDEGTKFIAVVEGEVVSGTKAAMIEKVLRGEGWPAESPDRILHGMYVWAAEVSQDEPIPQGLFEIPSGG
jgi:hypothetical protein